MSPEVPQVKQDPPNDIETDQNTDKLAAMRKMLSESDSDIETMKIEYNKKEIKSDKTDDEFIKPTDLISPVVIGNNTTVSKKVKPDKEQNVSPMKKDTAAETDNKVAPQEKNIQILAAKRKEESTVNNVKTTPGLPVGWQKRVDQNSGKVYFIDHNTQTTHWVLPADIIDKNIISPGAKISTKPKNENIQKPVNTIPKNPGGTLNSNVDNKELKNVAPTMKPIVSTSPVDSRPRNNVPSKPPLAPSATLPGNNIPRATGPVPKPQTPPIQPQQMPPTIQNQPGENVANKRQVQSKVIPSPSQNQTNQIPPAPKKHIIPQKPDILVQPAPAPSTTSVKPPTPIQHKPMVPNQPIVNKPPVVTATKQPKPSRPSNDLMDVPKQPSLKRSLSSPNLAENLAAIRANKPKIPIVDRGSKPM